MNYSDEHGDPVAGDVLLVVVNEQSVDNGVSWKLMRRLSKIPKAEKFSGVRSSHGPSLSGFWGNVNEIRSGLTYSYCSRFDGTRWRSMA